MREIKFRAWDYKNDKMRDWEDVSSNWAMFVLNEHDRQIWMQFTGLKDKHGREVYEGDVLKAGAAMHGDAFLIRQALPLTRTAWSYVERVGFWQGKKYHPLGEKRTRVDISYDDILSFSEECEVIGNMYENPELLN